MMRKALGLFFFANISVGIVSVALTIETLLLLHIPVSVTPMMLVIFFATLFEYSFHQILPINFSLRTDLPSAEPRTGRQTIGLCLKQMIGHKIFITVLILSVIGLLIFGLMLPARVMPLLFLSGLITLAYSLPLLKTQKKFITLKELPAVKTFISSLLWALVTVVLPLVYRESEIFDMKVMLLFAQRFFFIFSVCMIFDIRDMERDKNSGVKTLAVIMGERQALYSANLALFCFVLLVVVQGGVCADCIISAVPMLLSAAIAFYFINSKKIKAMPYYYKGFIDGLPVLQMLLLCIAIFLS